jgi:hypothetical protein
VDAEGQRFDGARRYRLRLPPSIPARHGWSVVLYDTQTRSMLQTDQRFPSISSRRGCQVDDDGSIAIEFGPTPPEGAGNWLQTVPGKGWSIILRLDGPLQPFFDGSWRPGELEPLP